MIERYSAWTAEVVTQLSNENLLLLELNNSFVVNQSKTLHKVLCSAV